MLTDLRGLEIKPGDVIIFGNVVMKVIAIHNSVISTQIAMHPNNPVALPGKLICEAEINIDFTKPFAGFKLAVENKNTNATTNN